MKNSTKAIHHGQEPEQEYGSVISPIYPTTTYIQTTPGQYKGYDYTRAGNPNFTRLEIQLKSLEKAKYATVFSSGLGAITAIISLLEKGNKVLAVDDLYGGTYRLFTKIFNKFGIKFATVDMQDFQKLKKELGKKPTMIFIESPTNPLLKIIDLKKITKLAHRAGTKVVVDNTFATPIFQNPLSFGADIVIHSTTKYIGGHSDVVGGVVMTNSLQIKEAMDFARKAIGLNPSPFDVWLTSRGVKTLDLRMKQHEINAQAVANFFVEHPLVKKVFYPGLKSHIGYNIAKDQMSGFGGIVSVDFKLNFKQVSKMISNYKIFTLAESLGGIESLVNHPAIMTHSSIPKKQRLVLGITDSLVRYSVGIEDTKDLIKDLESGLKI